MISFKKFVASSALSISLFGNFIPGVLSVNQAIIVEAAVIGDDYPSKWKAYPVGSLIPDNWGMYVRQCTSFVANRLSTVNMFNLPGGYGNASTWESVARSQGYRVDMNPAVGSVVWWNWNHVGWVAEVKGDQVRIEEYNHDYKGNYFSRWIDKNNASGYIHFKDLNSSSNTGSQTSGGGQNVNIPSSGVYKFDGKYPIKAEAKLSSPDLDYYSSGSTVNYDRKLDADGYTWISYLSYQGNRRYIPVIKNNSASTNNTTNSQIQNSNPAKGINYLTHISSYGWQPWVSNGKSATSRVGNRVEAIALTVNNLANSGSIEYRSHIQDLGWQNWSSNGNMSGTTGQSKRLEAIEIRLTGDLAKNYDVKYRVNVQGNGWQNWVTNGNVSGTIGKSLEIYDIQVDLIPKGTSASSGGTAANWSLVKTSGTHVFKEKSDVRAEPKMSSSSLATYSPGQSVSYDYKTSFDGYEWISYIAGSGNRRFIAIRKL
ncbi:SH3 domain-containing protein [Floricoccus penangensis]|uniref:SH3 domain-containing protein n=1 Tax=Floricoccus penangensis TaxID=1859475 RepID=UPI002040E628|nr:SH3 domain-containing protein [Floricoccus penangensis]URZ86568.1 SH3 domain-containing protein [Floricoccus penangensis]